MNAYQVVLLTFGVILGLCGVWLAGLAVYRDDKRLAVAAAGALLMFLSTMIRLSGEL
jgi:hypothetical protein